jgi:hypothetical protein
MIGFLHEFMSSTVVTHSVDLLADFAVGLIRVTGTTVYTGIMDAIEAIRAVTSRSEPSNVVQVMAQ